MLAGVSQPVVPLVTDALMACLRPCLATTAVTQARPAPSPTRRRSGGARGAEAGGAR